MGFFGAGGWEKELTTKARREFFRVQKRNVLDLICGGGYHDPDFTDSSDFTQIQFSGFSC